ncbi:hypothetical protein CLU79DRAFT_525773 [Phycomyces nitens]|nr:hypothetical protein CLU79DRAFT_525773 [Phycomyces nitens]
MAAPMAAPTPANTPPTLSPTASIQAPQSHHPVELPRVSVESSHKDVDTDLPSPTTSLSDIKDEDYKLNVAQEDDLFDRPAKDVLQSPPVCPLTMASLAEQNDLLEQTPRGTKLSPNAIRAWAADLPNVPDTIVDDNSCVYEVEETFVDDGQPIVQETKDVFTDSQKVAYVGLCALTSVEVVHDFQGKDFAYARMSADNWQRKWMKLLYSHMGISGQEIQMIESLSKHNILPSDLVHQFTAQGETTTVQMGNLHFKQTTEKHRQDQVVIDLRWTVMCDLLLLCLGSENYDARSRVFVARIASYLDLEWLKVIAFEKRIADHLIQNESSWDTESVFSIGTQTNIDDSVAVRNDAERKGRNKQRKKKRYVMIGLATIGGGLILGLSAGLMAPMIAGGLGAFLTTVGVSGSAGFLGGTASIALITSGATVAGGRIGAVSMNKRMKTINTFEFLPVRIDENVGCIITITGWLPNTDNREDETILPFSTLDPLMGDHFTLFWEPDMLVELGSAFKIMATEAVTFSIQQALGHTVLGALMAGLTFPLALTKLGYLVDNPWANGLDRARLAGLVLADCLMNRNLGSRPITLVGYSLGARMIFYCLLELARMNCYGLIENVALFGTPVSASRSQWNECTTVVAGKFINGYATNDWLLGFLFRASTAGLGDVAGLRPLDDIEGDRVQNLDCTDLIKGHLSYRLTMPKLLKRAGFVVTSEELPESKEKEKDTSSSILSFPSFGRSSPSLQGEESPELGKDNKRFSFNKNRPLSSFSSGKASIQMTVQQAPKPTDQYSPGASTSPLSNSLEDTNGPSKSPLSDKKLADDSTLAGLESTRKGSTDGSSKSITEGLSDNDIIADIIASATAAASSKSGTYSSLSSGKASITSTNLTSETDQTKSKGFFSITGRSKSETLTTESVQQFSTNIQNTSSETLRSQSVPNIVPASNNTTNSNRSSLFGLSLFGKKKNPFADDEAHQALKEAGVEIKEIKTTLGCSIVPDTVANPMPIVVLEAPQHARINK